MINKLINKSYQMRESRVKTIDDTVSGNIDVADFKSKVDSLSELAERWKSGRKSGEISTADFLAEVDQISSENDQIKVLFKPVNKLGYLFLPDGSKITRMLEIIEKTASTLKPQIQIIEEKKASTLKLQILENKLQSWIDIPQNQNNRVNCETAKKNILKVAMDGSDYLNLMGLRLNSLPPCINELKSLTKINLSTNNITSIPENAFEGLNNLNYLNLTNNKIQNIAKNAFHGLNKLGHLNLSYNNITSIPENAFHGLNLKRLDLSNNNITAIAENVLRGLNNLYFLDLSINNITSIPENAFHGLNKLEDLNLSNNKITAIAENAFEGLNNLNFLNLSINNITSIAENAFHGLNKLYRLDLSNNNIITVAENAFEGLNKLDRLDLSKNNITSIAENAFHGLNKLDHLDLSINNIASIVENAFEGLNNLFHLDLSNNNITTVAEDFVEENFVARHFPCKITLENAFRGLDRDSIQTIHHNFHKRKERTFKDTLANILRAVGKKNKLLHDWNNANYNEFKTFIDELSKIADMMKSEDDKWNAKLCLADIIIKMDTDMKIRDRCITIASNALGDCGDAINNGFLEMQITAKLDFSNTKIETLFENEKKLSTFNFVLTTIIPDKIKALRHTGVNDPDQAEVGLAFFKALKDELGITIKHMLHEWLSHVTGNDINRAKALLNTYISNPNNIYKAMADSDVVKDQFKVEFGKISNKDEYDTTPRPNENDNDYQTRVAKMKESFIEEKVKLLKNVHNIEKLLIKLEGRLLKNEIEHILSLTEDRKYRLEEFLRDENNINLLQLHNDLLIKLRDYLQYL